MHAFATTIRNSTVIMPAKIARLVTTIPDWIYPFVRIIDGTVMRERILELEYRTDITQQITPRDEPIYGGDPALAIGSFVLTGWGPRDIEPLQKLIEEESKAAEERRFLSQALRQRRVWRASAWVLIPLAVVLIIWRHIGGPDAIILSAVAFCLGLYAALQAVSLDRAVNRLRATSVVTRRA
jgi:hypothetical protein